MNCTSCGAPMRTENGIFKCDYCHNVIVPEKDDDGVSFTTDADEACPICSIPMTRATLGTLPLLICTRCDGMVITMDEFQDLIAASRAAHHRPVPASPANRDDLRRTIACPHCHRPMEAHFYGGPGNVIINTCESCSLNWLDHGELSRIAQAPVSDFPPDNDSDYNDSDSDPASDDAAPYPETSPAARPALFSPSVWKADL